MRTATPSKLLAALLLTAVTAVGHAQLTNRAEPLPGITTSGQPDEAAVAELADGGFAAVIDLRTPEENRGFDEREAVERLGMTYVSLPLSGPDSINYENAAALDAILREIGQPVLIHCATGNRAGALLSLRQRLIGTSAEEALATGIQAGMTSPVLRSVVEGQLLVPLAQ